MSTIAVKPSGAEKMGDSGMVWLRKAIAGRLGLWKLELAVLRDRKIYADFFSAAYQQHNISRLQHLESLGVDLARKSVLEVGAGIGDHSLFYLYRNCRLLAVEGRARLAKKLSERLGIDVKVVDLDREPERLEQFGRFDLVHCYGLLYHLSDPARFLSIVSRVGDCLLLETCVSFGDELSTNKCGELSSIPSQALHGEGCRPTREWIFEQLKLHYQYVYATRTQPRHPEFPTDWSGPSHERASLKRAVFVASHSPISSPNLVTELPQKQAWW
jgi:methyltransferase family protein